MKALVCGALLLLCGCSTLLADRGEYVAYRRTRTAETLEQRLIAGQRYLDQHPEGRWHSRVQRWFDTAESAYFARARKSQRGLEDYLNTLPHGPHAAAASQRLAELELARRYAHRREQRITESAQRVEEKLADAASMRQRLQREVGAWAARLAAIRSFGQRTSELDRKFLLAYRVEEPAARCSSDRCVKSVSLPYAIPADRKLTARRAIFDVALELSDGEVASAWLGGPELWSRVGEAAGLSPVRPSDAMARTEAVARSVSLVEAALEPVLPSSRCSEPAVGLRVLVRRCDGVELVMTAAADAADDDRIDVRPTP